MSAKQHSYEVLLFNENNNLAINAYTITEALEKFAGRDEYKKSDGPWLASVLHPIQYEEQEMLKNHGIKLCTKLGKPPEEFMKFDDDKLRYDLIPPEFLEGIAKVLTDGAKKYEADNWRKNKELWRYQAAAMRHFEAYRSGESVDPDSGSSHLHHVATNILFLSILTDQNESSQDK